jgi:hypothetical protein
MSSFQYLKRWTRPTNYLGKEYTDYFPVYSITRDSDLLEQSNFATILARLGGDSPTVVVDRVHHWAFGWIDTIFVHESDPTVLQTADNLLAAIAVNLILDEDDYENRVHDATLELVAEINRFPDQYPDRPADDKLYEYARTLVTE